MTVPEALRTTTVRLLAAAAVAVLGFTPIASRAGESSLIQLGVIRVLSTKGADAEDPQLAMNGSGAYLLTWADNQLFGPFSSISGTAASRAIPRRAVHYGRREDVEPLEPGISRDGHRAIMYGVRRVIGKNVLFGLDLAEAAPGDQGWVTRRLAVPPTNVDLDAIGGPAFTVDGRFAATWATQAQSHVRAQTQINESLVLAQQPRFGAPVRTRRLFTDRAGAGVVPLAPAFDASGHVVVAFWTGEVATAVLATSPPSSTGVLVHEKARAITTTASGRLRPPQLLRTDCEEQQLVVAASGAAAISMICDTGQNRTQIYIAERRPGRPFGKPMLASGRRNRDEFEPQLSLTSDGRLWLAWEHRKSLNPRTGGEQVRTEVTSAKLGAPFSAPEWKTRYINSDCQPTFLGIRTGQMFLATQNARGRVVVRALRRGGSLGRPTALSPPTARNPEVQVDARGRGMAVWSVFNGRVNQAEARRFNLR